MSLEFTFACPLKAGLHARPASLFSERANAFACECTLTNLRTGASANLRSTLAIISADVREGDSCRVVCSGEDEGSAYASLRQWIEQQLPAVDDALPVPEKTSSQLPRALRDAACDFLPGTGVSAGIGAGVVMLAGRGAWPVLEHGEGFVNPALERERVSLALATVANRVGSLLARAKSKTEAAILKAHLAILRDVSLIGQIHEYISQGQPAGVAVIHAAEHFRDVLRASASAYIRERVFDLQDVCVRLLESLEGVTTTHSLNLSGPTVVVGENLTPQELLSLQREHVAGLILEYAGVTSHTVILARSLGIPTLAAVSGASADLHEGERVIVDALRGFVIKDNAPAIHRFYARELETQRRRKAWLGQKAMAPAETQDGRRLEVAANVSTPLEVKAAFESGADGVGVYRTEMLFVERNSAPTEEEQFEIYAEAARAAGGRPVILRTLDVGGDKRVPHLDLPEEPNPFLGYRGARIYPENLELFRAQVRAMLRAAAFGRVQIMLPMIANAAEVRWAREQVEQVRRELQTAGIATGEAPVGIMIEVPSIAYTLDELSEVADFFSVGTNDLSQYFFAADRGNARVWPLANPIQPAFLRFLKDIIDKVHANKKWIGICGEMGGEPKLLPLMLGLGFDEISASVPNVGPLKQSVSRLRQDECARLLARAVGCKTAEEVEALLEGLRTESTALPLLDAQLVRIDSDSESKEETVRELVDALYAAGRVEDRQRLEDAVWAREEVYSTALGFGFAIPHCKNDVVLADSIAVVKLARPVQWGPEEKVEFAILLAMRESAKDNTHMQVFSRLARKLMNDEFRGRLKAAVDAEAVVGLLASELAVAK